MNNVDTDLDNKIESSNLFEESKKVFEALLQSEDNKIYPKKEITKILSEKYKGFSDLIIEGIVSLKKVKSKQGAGGGIEYIQEKYIKRKLTANDEKQLINFFDSKVSEIQLEEKDKENDSKNIKKIEKDLYEPLRKYLENSGNYNIVHSCGDERRGDGKWSNPDLIAVKYWKESKYHFGIFPKLTGFEVKFEYPTIEHIQQTASYLRLCHCAYLCFYVETFTKTNHDDLIKELRKNKFWDWANRYGIGLIVAFYPTKVRKIIQFQ